jgi:hypothetical protein
MYLPCMPNGSESTASQQLHTNGIFSIVCCLLLMVAFQIPMPHNVKCKSIKRPSVRGGQTLVVLSCSGSLCPRTNVPFCHRLTPNLIWCSTLYPRIKGIKDYFYCKTWVHGNKLWSSKPSPNLGGLGSWCCTPPIGVCALIGGDLKLVHSVGVEDLGG